MDLDALTRMATFATIPPAQVEVLRDRVVESEVAAGEIVVRQDEAATELNLIVEGPLASWSRDVGDGLEYEGPRLGAGDSLGLVEILLGVPHPMTVVATGPVRLASIPRDAIQTACGNDPILAAGLLRVAAERLHAAQASGVGRMVDLARLKVDESLWTLLPHHLILKYRALPLARNGNVMVVGFVDPGDLVAVDDVGRLLTGFKVRAAAMDSSEFERYYRNRVVPSLQKARPEDAPRDRWYSVIRQKTHGVQLVETLPTASADERGKQVSGEMVVALANRLIGEALELGASDIHIEPSEHELTVRYRVDGRLKKRPESVDPRFHAPLVSRIKALGRMDIAERRKAQDGRLTVAHGDRAIDFRLATVPTRFGEKIVLRILDPNTILIDLERLVTYEPAYRALRWMVEQPQGLVVVAGPTGSGKTTTIYSALLRLREDEINIVTIEDPIEYTIEGLTQVQVNDAAGVSFATAIRHFLRQDPDVIVVGETRDPVTASTTVEAALTGHLVFTSLHANDAVGAIVRLREMGVESFLLAHTVIGVVSQRLLRRTCPHCRQPTQYHPDMIRPLGLFDDDESTGPFTFQKGAGCLNCNFQGYRGRVAAFDVLRVDERLRPIIASAPSMQEVERAARESGLLVPMREMCRHLLSSGITTPEEVARVLFAGM